MMHSTTILAVRHRDRAVLAGDGQVTFGQTVVKQGARKIRRLYNDRILAGFIEPDDGLVAIGSGGPFALAAARALARHTDLDARTIAERSMAIASEICIYTNGNLVLEEL
jgi:ATP-dependent protease HslVU (ClpYQ) peptidase subunit